MTFAEIKAKIKLYVNDSDPVKREAAMRILISAFIDVASNEQCVTQLLTILEANLGQPT